jgi:hypothetical protein
VLWCQSFETGRNGKFVDSGGRVVLLFWRNPLKDCYRAHPSGVASIFLIRASVPVIIVLASVTPVVGSQVLETPRLHGVILQNAMDFGLVQAFR